MGDKGGRNSMEKQDLVYVTIDVYEQMKNPENDKQIS